jgi:hypothetical protein
MLLVDAPMRELEEMLRRPGQHVVDCVGVTERRTTYGPTRVLIETADVHQLVDGEARRSTAGWDIIDSDNDIDD